MHRIVTTSAKQNRLPIVKCAISMVVLVMLIVQIEAHNLSSLLTHISFPALGIAGALIFAQIILQSLRWSLLINGGRQRLSMDRAMHIGLVSQLGDFVFVNSLGGVIARTGLAKQAGVRWPVAICAALGDRLSVLLTLVVLATPFLPMVGAIARNQQIVIAISLVLLATLSIGIMAYLYWRSLFRLIYTRNTHMTGVYRYLSGLFRDYGRLTAIAAASVIGQFCFFLAAYSIAGAMVPDLAFLSFMALMPLITVIAAIPISYNGWGVRESAFVMGLGLLDVPLTTAFFISVQIGVLGMLVRLATGLVALSRYPAAQDKHHPASSGE